MAEPHRPPPLTAEEVEALRAYARKHGRRWKCQLRQEWFYARTSGALQTLRNTHALRNTHGPTWLESFRLSALDATP